MEKVKNLKYCYLFCVCLLFFLALTGFTYPTEKEGSYYIQGNFGSLGSGTIYIPYNSNYQFYVKDNEVINVCASTITGYFNDQTITFPVYSIPYYRVGSYTYTINFNEITDYKLPLMNGNKGFIDNSFPIITIFSLLLMVMFQLFKR